MNQLNKNISDSFMQTLHQNDDLLRLLKSIVGKKHVLSGGEGSRQYPTGFRLGTGKALAVVRPGTLIEQWRVLKVAIAANKIIIMQTANTGLTGGPIPCGEYDRDVIIINSMRINKIQIVNDGAQVICLPGATLDQLEKILKPLGREPHSVIGSSCIGASVVGGVCNNSGGALVKRGPVYTELAIFAQLDGDGRLTLVNHLGISLGDEPEAILGKLERGEYRTADVYNNVGRASDESYSSHVRDTQADTPSRFSADATRLHEVSGSAGKLSVFAVRLDTFPAEPGVKVFYVGANTVSVMAEIRKRILEGFSDLPIAGEYLHRDAYDMAEKYGKDIFLINRYLGEQKLPCLFALKNNIDNFCRRIPMLRDNFTDRAIQKISVLFPKHLPKRMSQFRNSYEHHLLLKVSGSSVEETRAFFDAFFSESGDGSYFECTPDEGKKAFLHRFAAAGAAVRYRTVHQKEVENIIALDIALRRNDQEWFEKLPSEIDTVVIKKLYYGHFLCHVFHQDYIIRKGIDCVALEHKMLELLDQRGAQHPAERNVGHLYNAPPNLAQFYKKLDPCNQFNPGIGKTTKYAHWNDVI